MHFSVKALAFVSTFALAGGASAATIFSDSFENPVNTQDWQVYDPNFGADWTVMSGTGIEIQTSGVVVNAHDGNQYVELDSDTERNGDADNSGDGTNSSMTRTLNLAAGQYRLDWYYLPRTSTADDNVISVYLDGATDGFMTNLLGSENGTRPPINDWTLISYTFTVDGNGSPYALTFAASGLENEFGGFIDSVTLSQVPVPAGFLLMGTALAGLGVASRRRRKAS